jgi:hypothetical protein
MAKSRIIVRQAVLADIDGYLKLQAERWNQDNMAHRDQLESRLKAYPQGMLVAERNGEIVGMTYAMRITDYDFENPPSWNAITHNGYCDNADPQGKFIFGVDLSTAKGVGHLAGDQLLLQVARIAIAENIKFALLGGRMPGYHKHASTMSAEQYLWAKDDKGRPLDRQVRYYTSIPGLNAIKAIPNYFNDPDSLDYGVLLTWRNPLYRIPGRKMWSDLFPYIFRVEELIGKFKK